MRSAFIRALRTAAQTLAGALVAFPTVDSVTKLQQVGSPLILAIYTAIMAGVVSFLQNCLEDAADAPPAIKG